MRLVVRLHISGRAPWQSAKPTIVLRHPKVAPLPGFQLRQRLFGWRLLQE